MKTSAKDDFSFLTLRQASGKNVITMQFLDVRTIFLLLRHLLTGLRRRTDTEVIHYLRKLSLAI